MTYPTLTSTRRAIQRNESTPCNATGCGLPRVGLQAFCSRHTHAARAYGHPFGVPLKPSYWAAERKAVRDVFTCHSDHAGLVNVTQWVSRWVTEAVALDERLKPPKGTRELARLARHGVSALEIVTEAAAHAIWESRNPHFCPDSKAQVFALGRAVMALAPRPRKPYSNRASHNDYSKSKGYATAVVKASPSDTEAIGRKLRDTLAAFIVTCRTAVDQRDQQSVNVLAQMREPFRPPAAVLVNELAGSGHRDRRSEAAAGDAAPLGVSVESV